MSDPCSSFPNNLARAEEIRVVDGTWTGIFYRRAEQSEGWFVFSKTKGERETWRLMMKEGAWTFFNMKQGQWTKKEKWVPALNRWETPNGEIKKILVTVTKCSESFDESVDESWGDNLVRKIWEQGIAYDMKIKLQDGEEIKAHKVVIAAACPAWKALLESNMVEAQCGIINVTDINPNVVKGFVKALYYGEVEDKALLPGIAVMADRYNAKRLLDKVVKAIALALETEGPEFYNEVVETLKQLPDSENKNKLKEMLYTMNLGISKELFYQRLGIN